MSSLCKWHVNWVEIKNFVPSVYKFISSRIEVSHPCDFLKNILLVFKVVQPLLVAFCVKIIRIGLYFVSNKTQWLHVEMVFWLYQFEPYEPKKSSRCAPFYLALRNRNAGKILNVCYLIASCIALELLQLYELTCPSWILFKIFNASKIKIFTKFRHEPVY